VADYFNAEAGQLMQVVSWTGDDVEFYNGVNLARGMVLSAFNLPPAGFGGGRIFSSLGGSAPGDYNSGLKFALQAAFAIFLFFIFFGRTLSCSTDYEASPVKKISAGAPPLIVGASGRWNDKNYRITAHAVVEIAEVGLIYERHEYELADDYGMKALLVCGDKPGTGDWIFFEPLAPLLPLPTAKQAATKKVGDALELDGFVGKVSEIFRTTIEQADGDGSVGMKNGAVFYGLTATSEYRALLARWNGDSILYLRGQSTTAKKLSASFAASQ
jgi:hypothetical protein